MMLMPKRKLRIVKRTPAPIIGVCEACNQQFKSQESDVNRAEWEISKTFASHECMPIDSSQNAVRIVREANENK
jgi:hypothetical protein